ncbi:four-helix bundle copper-binding protein [Sessilibacter corallicola]|uniref:four-helix bundle copper-binding protein n=1 Tax=Sessilibacter corallicola TaxID=2904075 RepID=UPI001E3BD77E|nr:four-helix bundle copper-binding protein [Sessilibacter corallicola]MCE2029377.1 four-helix bundle copper-binding protein [Sessilibacter corallicola]
MKTSKNMTIESESKRNFLVGALALGLATSVSSAFAKSKDDHHHHHHVSDDKAQLVDAAIDCVKNTIVCRDHCIELLKTGDTTLTECLDISNDTIAMCNTLTQLSSSNSDHLMAFAKVSLAVCQDCEKECRRHKDKHQACKDCMESCSRCIDAIEKYMA